MDVSYSFDKVNSAIETLKNTIDDFDASKLNDLLWGTNEGLTDEQAQALAALRKALTDMDFSADTDGVNAFIQALVQVGIVAQSSANGVDALAAGAQKMEDISSKMDEIQSAYKASTSAMEEYNQYGYMSLDSLQSLLTMNTEYLNCLELVNGKLQINKQSYAELLAAEYAEAAATILSNAQHEVANLTADDTAESTDGLKEKTEAEKTALENLLPALKNATAATATYSAAQEFANEVEKAGERGVDPAKLEEITNRTNTQLSLLYTNMNAALKGGQALTNQLNGFGSSSKNAGKSSSATSKSVADLSSAFDTLTKAMKEYNQYGYISADTIKSLIGVDDKFTACLTEQNGKLELNTAKFRTFVRAQLEEANAANDGGKSAGEMKKILDWLNSSVDSETISFEQLTDAIKGYGTAMDEAKEKTDAIKSAFSGLYDIQQKIKNSQFGVGDLDATESKIESILQLSKFFGDNKDLMDNLVDKNGNINLNTEAFKQATLKELDKRIEAANQTGGAAATALANSLSSDKANIESGKISVSDYLVGLGTDLERVNTELDKYQTNWSTLKDAMDEWNTTGQLTQDTMQKLQELPEEFSNLLTYDEDGNAKIDVKALRQSYVDKLSAFAKEFEGSPIGIQVQAMIDDVREPTDEYEWLTADDENLLKILKIVSKESDTADGSRRVFFNTPSPPYSKGDVWADYSFNGYMLVCQVSRPISASYNRLDWVVASKYTDDTKADEALDSANKANADLATFKTEYDSDLKVTKEQIEARVTATTYTEDMSSLKKRVSTAESRITQTEKDITLRVEKDDYTGEKLVSMISAQPESVKISAKNIELTGAVTIQNGQTVLNSESVNNSITQIDGGKITTGTIDANRLNLSGGLTIGSGGSITIGNNTISADKLASGSVFKELWRNYEETEYKVGTFSFDNSQTQYNELLFFFRGLFKNGKVDDSQEGTITHVEQVPTGNTDSYGNPEYETKTIIDSKIRIETYYTSTNTMVVPLITNSTIWYHTFFSYPSAYFVRQWEHYKADPSQNIIQGTYKEGMSFNTDVVDNMDYQWCNSNIMRYFSVSVSQNNTVTVTFKNAFRYTTKKGFWDDSGKVSIYPNYAIPRIIYGIK